MHCRRISVRFVYTLVDDTNFGHSLISGEAQDGDDSVRQPHAGGHEEGVGNFIVIKPNCFHL